LILIPFSPDFNLSRRVAAKKLIFNRKNNRIAHRRKEVVKAASAVRFFEKRGAVCGPELGAIERYEKWTDRFQGKNKSRKIKVPKGSHTRRQWEALKERFNQTCPGCGSRGRLTKDHAISRAYGRRHNTLYWDSIDNIQPLCPKCNQKKGDRSFSYWRDSSGKVIVRSR